MRQEMTKDDRFPLDSSSHIAGVHFPIRISSIRKAPNMPALSIMLIVWGVITAAFLALLAYKATLTRYEEDQLFLNDQRSNEQDLQGSIVRSINRIQPLLVTSGILSAALGTLILGLYTWHSWLTLHAG